MLSPACTNWFRRRLLSWYRGHARDLPWRHSRDPYAIWVSEVMLQQTQVATVIPYFDRFTRALPTIAALARAPLAKVLRLWQGLGYYRRARHLHEAARLLVRSHGGELPNEPAVLDGLPGFGRYTVGAVLSQAFNRPMPILEANSRRLLARFFGSRAGDRALWELAEALVPDREPGEFNQALMELGALVCTARVPACTGCPLRSKCVANGRSEQGAWARAVPRPRIERIAEVAIVPVHDGRMLLLERRQQDRWAGLWEFPHAALKPGESAATAAARVLDEQTSLRGQIKGPIGTVRYSVTRFRYELICFKAECRSKQVRLSCHAAGRWVKEPRRLPLSSPQRRLAELMVV
jgi:A/G-specific adenine glycosylase